MVRGRFGDVGKDAPLDCDVVLEALSGEPRKVDGGVYADRLEGCAGIAGGWEF